MSFSLKKDLKRSLCRKITSKSECKEKNKTIYAITNRKQVEIVYRRRKVVDGKKAVYEENGNAYVAVCDSMGYTMLVDANGNLLYTISLGGLVEASPAVYEDMLVVGTRAEKICGVKIS